MPGELRVDTTPLATEGQGLLSAAGDIPQPPVPFTATGADALSTILNARTQAMEAPLIAGLPVTKAEALRTAQNIIQAAAKYEGVDQQLADQVLKALAELEGAEGMGAGGVGGAGGGAAGADMAGTPATAATSAATPAAGAAQQAGQMGQLMGMPMQMAQQAAQIPMQLAGMAASIPQGIMQGVQSAMQQVGQMTGGAGEETDPEMDQPGDGSPDEARHAESAEEKPEQKAVTPSEGAAGPTNAERAPATGPQPTPSPEVPQQPHKPAPTRPATSGPESVL
jgi:hypothetical protein